MSGRARRPGPSGEGPTGTLHVLRVELAEIDPPIWRDLLLPSDATLAILHEAIQAAFPWTNSHLHVFRAGRSTWGDPEGDPECEDADERGVTLAEVLPLVGSRIEYEYDFGDSWHHEVTLREVRPPSAGAAKERFQCLGGARACPPDDCGGVPGYEDLLKGLGAKNHPEHEELSTWLRECREELAEDDERFRGPFDPEAFDLEAANRAVSRIAGRGRRRT